MRVNSKGQVTIPAELRHKHHLDEGDEVVVVEREGSLVIERAADAPDAFERTLTRMRGSVNNPELAGMSTDEIMQLLRGDD